LGDIAEWLNSKLYISNYRPVPLNEYVIYENQVLDKNKKIVRELKTTTKNDPDNLISICLEIIPENSILIFCYSKQACEKCATHLIKNFPVSFKEYKVCFNFFNFFF
jgi:replicative superfamily II helicase